MITTPAQISPTAGVYTDFNGLERLRGQARQDQQAALPEVAQQFEALFLQMLLKSMRETTVGDPLLADQGAETYQGLFDQQMALTLARSRSVGLADLLVRELGEAGQRAADQPTAGTLSGPSPGRLGRLSAADSAEREPPVPAEDQTSATKGPAMGWSGGVAAPEITARYSPPAPSSLRGTTPGRTGFMNDDVAVTVPVPDFATPQRFVQSLLPHAKAAGKALGVSPEVLLAQAALETGWGRSMIRHPHGGNSFNLFGIKASEQWQGARVTVPTLEFIGGVMERRQSSFRAYASPGESFQDYVNLIRTSPRYRQALASAEDPAAYVRNLQAAGYATDPDYAAKVLAVMASPALRASEAGLQMSRAPGPHSAGW